MSSATFGSLAFFRALRRGRFLIMLELGACLRALGMEGGDFRDAIDLALLQARVVTLGSCERDCQLMAFHLQTSQSTLCLRQFGKDARLRLSKRLVLGAIPG